jgi:hypothetical protein
MKQIIHHAWRRFLTFTEDFDDMLMGFFKARQSLMAAIIGLMMLIWGIAMHQYFLLVAVVLAGAIGYGMGFTPAFLIAFILIVIPTRFVHLLPIAEMIIEIIGTSIIAWLGREHRLTARKRLLWGGDDYEKQIVSWTFVNEVRNSLLAMRLLLFQKNQDNSSGTNLKLIEDELLRLESLFGKLHDKNSSK